MSNDSGKVAAFFAKHNMATTAVLGLFFMYLEFDSINEFMDFLTNKWVLAICFFAMVYWCISDERKHKKEMAKLETRLTSTLVDAEKNGQIACYTAVQNILQNRGINEFPTYQEVEDSIKDNQLK